jgi:hypothetical protein
MASRTTSDDAQVRPLRSTLPTLRKAHQVAIEAGDWNHACFAGALLLHNLLMAGDPLEEVAEEARAQLDFLRRVRAETMHDLLVGMERLVQSLLGETRELGSFDAPDFDGEAFEARAHASSHYVWWTYFTFKSIARFLAGDAAAAVAAATAAKPFVVRPSMSWAEGLDFFTALASAAQHDELAPEERRTNLDRLLECEEKLRVQRSNCPESFESRHALVAAEIARIEGRDLEAIRSYEQSIASARRSCTWRPSPAKWRTGSTDRATSPPTPPLTCGPRGPATRDGGPRPRSGRSTRLTPGCARSR